MTPRGFARSPVSALARYSALVGLFTGALYGALPAQERAAVVPVRGDLYLATSPSGNVGMRITPEGVVLVAGELPGAMSSMRALVDRVSDQPIRYLVNTHRHPARPVVRDPATELPRMLVHANAWKNTRAGAPEGRGGMTFDTGLTVHLGGAEIRALHFGPAHTDGDAVVYFPDLRVVHAGDLLHGIAPFIDYANGGTSRGWVAALNAMLELDFDLAIPAHGSPMSRADVIAFRNQMEAVRTRMAELIRAGALRRHVGAGIVSRDLSWTLSRSGGFMARSLSGLYNEIQAEVRLGGLD